MENILLRLTKYCHKSLSRDCLSSIRVLHDLLLSIIEENMYTLLLMIFDNYEKDEEVNLEIVHSWIFLISNFHYNSIIVPYKPFIVSVSIAHVQLEDIIISVAQQNS